MSTADGRDTVGVRLSLHALIRAEKRDVWRYTRMLWFDLSAARAERERWKSLRSYHQGQIDRCREELRKI